MGIFFVTKVYQDVTPNGVNMKFKFVSWLLQFVKICHGMVYDCREKMQLLTELGQNVELLTARLRRLKIYLCLSDKVQHHDLDKLSIGKKQP